MIFTVDSDAAYLLESKVRSRAAGYFYLGNWYGKIFNGPIFVLAEVIKTAMASVSETECVGLYMKTQESVPIRNTLIELGHLHPPYGKSVSTYSSTENEIMNITVKPNKYKSMDMRFWWLVNEL